ncbi:hypothetical protein B0H14DRAFT_3435053 [Mycena olivaceomarginata]|nr:hypothetical protein B0H14DRAFT_3435053 [Mycena olivaceomarginata]
MVKDNARLKQENAILQLTSLECNGGILYSAILPSLLQLSNTLKSLILTIPSTYDDGHPVLLFGSLEDLHLRLGEDSVVSTSNWLIPDLPRLRLHNRYSSRQKMKEPTDAYGASITFLGLFPEHSLRDLRVELEQPTGESLKGVFPALRRCRNLEAGIFQFRDMPLEVLDDNKVFAAIAEFPDANSIDGGVLIMRRDADTCVSEDGGYLADEFYMEEDWEVGHDEALDAVASKPFRLLIRLHGRRA